MTGPPDARPGCPDPRALAAEGAVAVGPAGAAHAAVLAALQADVFGPGPTAWPTAVWADWLAASGVAAVIACCDTVPLGLALGRVAGGEGEILTVAVSAPARRRGLGRRLLAALTTALSDGGAAKLFLEVAVDNQAALALYEIAGFRPVGRRLNYYPAADGSIDALILEYDVFATRTG